MRFTLRPAAPFRLDLTAWTLRRDPVNFIDRWDGRQYGRTVLLDDQPLELTVRQRGPMEQPELIAEVEASGRSNQLQSRLAALLDQILGLSLDLTEFHQWAERQPRLRLLGRQFLGLHPPRFPTLWEAAVNAISCQQLSLHVGLTFMNRLAVHYGPAPSSGTHAMPGPVHLAGASAEALRGIGYNRNKAAALLRLAGQITAGEIDLDRLASLDDQEAIARLKEIHGIGLWSAQYILLRGLGRTHILPGADSGFQKNLSTWLGRGGQPDLDAVARATHRWRAYGGFLYFFMLLTHLAGQGLLEPTVK